MNAFRVVGLGFVILAFIAALITVNIRKKKESQSSILMRIIANYFQVMTATLAYGMRFPEMMLVLFEPIGRVGQSSSTLLSFDWFVKDSQLKLFTPSNPFFKAFMTAILPILLFLGITSVFVILHLIFPKWFTDFKRNVVVSTITILFLLHPTLTTTAFGMFQCVQVDEGISFVKIDLNMEWYSADHIIWWCIIAVPMLVVWVFGWPILAFVALFKNRHKLNDAEFQRYFIVLYQGLKDDRFYWELINTGRKVIIVSINVFLSGYQLFYKGASAVILIVVFLRLQIALKPFKLELNNEWELLSYMASLITLFGGLLYVTDVLRLKSVDLFAFFVILLINVYFLLFWTYLMLSTYNKYKCVKKLTNILRIVLYRFKDEDIYNENFAAAMKESEVSVGEVPKSKKHKASMLK
jgi:hypothetical protein